MLFKAKGGSRGPLFLWFSESTARTNETYKPEARDVIANVTLWDLEPKMIYLSNHVIGKDARESLKTLCRVNTRI